MMKNSVHNKQYVKMLQIFNVLEVRTLDLEHLQHHKIV